jgi:hypothetical protein
VTDTDSGDAVTVTVALADCVEAKAFCAITVTGLVDTLHGAVYNPVEETVPIDEFPPTTPSLLRPASKSSKS